MMTKSSDIFPADAEVREAVEHLERSKGFYSRAEHLSVFVRSIDTLLSYVRAAQAPRLAEEQKEAVKALVEMVRTFGDNITVGERIQAIDRARAAFPGVFNGE